MDLAYGIPITRRKQRGEAASSDTDCQHVCRFATPNMTETPALQPIMLPRRPTDLQADNGIGGVVEFQRGWHALELAPCASNSPGTMFFGIPVTRVVRPGLEPSMTARPGPRLPTAAACSDIGSMSAVSQL